MTFHIIIKDRPYRFGKTRSEHEENLRKEGYQTLNDSQLDRCKYMEKKMYWEQNNKKNYFDQYQIGQVK